jgi:hypothetical protein
VASCGFVGSVEVDGDCGVGDELRRGGRSDLEGSGTTTVKIGDGVEVQAHNRERGLGEI